MTIGLQEFVRATTSDTVDYRLRIVFALAEDARIKNVMSVANRACSYLLALALDTDPDERLLFLDIATTDLYGNENKQTKFDLIVVSYALDTRLKTRIPIRLLTEDAQGRCRRRVGDRMIQRSPPRGKGQKPPRPSPSDTRNLEDRFSKILGGKDVNRIRTILHSG